eukprot:SAG25_NODE_2371_length_1674_cov_1.162540_1_plen_291_part_00
MATCTPLEQGEQDRWCGCAPNANGIPGQPNEVRPSCDEGLCFNEIVFASMGNPGGDCGAYTIGTCAAPQDVLRASIDRLCLQARACIVPTTIPGLVEGWAGCPGVTLYTAIEMTCGPCGASALIREWGALLFLAGLTLVFGVYVVVGAVFFPRQAGQSVPGFGFWGAHPHAHLWREFVGLVQDGAVYTVSCCGAKAAAAGGPHKTTRQKKKGNTTAKARSKSTHKSAAKPAAKPRVKSRQASPPTQKKQTKKMGAHTLKPQVDMSWMPPKPLLASRHGRETGVKVVSRTM